MPLSSPEPDSRAPRVQTRAEVVSTLEVAPRHFALSLRCAPVARGAKAGQFVHVLPRPLDQDQGGEAGFFDPLLRRAFSVMDAQGDEFQVLFRVEGRGTAQLARSRVGEWLDLIGPLGNGFSLRSVEAGQSAILVGGGVGVPPMVFAARELGEAHTPVQMLLGARSSGDVLCENRFAELGVPLHIATDDGSRGHFGRVDVLLGQALEIEPEAKVFACGPYPMLRAVAGLCEARGVACEVSLEENMPCGIGVCNGCVVATRTLGEQGSGDDYGRFQRICVHGPACEAREIAWT